MIKVILTLFFSILFFYISFGVFACEKSFDDSFAIRVDTLTVEEIRQLKPEEIQNLLKVEIGKFTTEKLQALDSIQILSLRWEFLSLQQLSFLTSSQVNSIITAKHKEWQSNDKFLVSVFIRIHIEKITADNIPLIPLSQINLLLITDIKKMSPEQVYNLTPEQTLMIQKNLRTFSPQSIPILEQKRRERTSK